MRLKIIIAFTIFTFSLPDLNNKRQINESGYLVATIILKDPGQSSQTVNSAKINCEASGPADCARILVLPACPAADCGYPSDCKAFANQDCRVDFYDQRETGLIQRFPKINYRSVQPMSDGINPGLSFYRKPAPQKVFLPDQSRGGIAASAYIHRYPTEIYGAVVTEPGGLQWKDVKGYTANPRKLKITSEALNNATYSNQFITRKKSEQPIPYHTFSLLSPGSDKSIHPRSAYGLPNGAAYGYPLTPQLPVILRAAYSFPPRDKIFDDFRKRIGVSIPLAKVVDFQFSAQLNGLFRRYENALSRLAIAGSDLNAMAGYYKRKWNIAAQFGFDKAIGIHFKYSEIYKRNFPKVRDGWEDAGGGDFYYGVQAGYLFKRHDIYFNGGRILTRGSKTTALVAFFAQLDYILKIN